MSVPVSGNKNQQGKVFCFTGLLLLVVMLFSAPFFNAYAEVSNPVTKQAVSKIQTIDLTVRNHLVSAKLKDIPLRSVLRAIAKQTDVKFYIDPTVKTKVSIVIKDQPIDKTINRLTKGLNVAFIWETIQKGESKSTDRIASVHILPKSNESALLEVIETASNSPVPKSTKQAKIPSNVPSSQSIFEARPKDQPRRFIKEMRDGVEVSYVSDELLIRIDPEQDFNNSIRWLNGVVRQYHGVLQQRMHRMRYLVARFAPNVNIQQLKKELLKAKAIQVAEPNYVAKMTGTVAPSKDWYLKQINAPTSSGKTKPSRYPVAIIDTGVDYNIPELKGMVIKGDDLINQDADPMDDNGHGTAMAILARQVAPNAPILAIKALDKFGNATNADIAEAIYRALDEKLAVINLSLGGYAASQALQDAIQYANFMGVPVVAAAGNDGTKGRAFYPAAYPNVIAVGSVDKMNHLAAFSNQGKYIDLVAPGVGLPYTKNGKQSVIKGTSASTALLAGAVALLKQQKYKQLPAEVAGKLYESANDLMAKGKDNATGYGTINLIKALSMKKLKGKYKQDFFPVKINSNLDVKQISSAGFFSGVYVAGESSQWLDLKTQFGTDKSLLFPTSLLVNHAKIATVLDDLNEVSVSVTEFRLSPKSTVKQVKFYVMAGKLDVLKLLSPPHKALTLATNQNSLPKGTAAFKFIDQDKFGIRDPFGTCVPTKNKTGILLTGPTISTTNSLNGCAVYNGLEFTDTFGNSKNPVVAYISDPVRQANIEFQLKSLPSHLLYSEDDYASDLLNMSLAKKNVSKRKPIGNRIPVVLIHGWQGHDDKWAETLLTQSEVEAWWEFAENDPQKVEPMSVEFGLGKRVSANGTPVANGIPIGSKLTDARSIVLNAYNTPYATNGFAGKHTSYVEAHKLDADFKFFKFRYPTGRSNKYNANILRDMINANPELAGHSDIIIIGHSTGGLLAKYMLLDPTVDPATKKTMADKVLRVITLATPHRGAFAGYDYDLDFTESLAPWTFTSAAIGIGQSFVGYNLETDGAVDLAWDGAWSDTMGAPFVPEPSLVHLGTAAKKYAPNTALAKANRDLLKNKYIYDKFIFYGGWLEVEGMKKVAKLTKLGCQVGKVAGGIVGCTQGALIGGLSGTLLAALDGSFGPHSNALTSNGAALVMSTLGMETDSVVPLPSSLMLPVNTSLSSLVLPDLSIAQDYSVDGKRRIFNDRDHSQMREGTFLSDKTGSAASDPLLMAIGADLQAIAKVVFMNINNGDSVSGNTLNITAGRSYAPSAQGLIAHYTLEYRRGTGNWTAISSVRANNITANLDISKFGLVGFESIDLRVGLSTDMPVNINMSLKSMAQLLHDSDTQIITIIVNNSSALLDTDGDGVPDARDAFAHDAAASVDVDKDGHPDAWNTGKTAADSTSIPPLTIDAFPTDPARWLVVSEIFPINGVLSADWIQPTGSFQPWVIDPSTASEGKVSMKSGTITHNQASSLEHTVITGSGSISFDYKVSSELNGDALVFYIDGAMQQFWHGVTGSWASVSYPVSAGIHTFKWSYIKDPAVSFGQDAAWIDNVVVPSVGSTGSTWVAMNNGLTNLSVSSIAIDPVTPSTLYAATSWIIGATFYKSVDRGANWAVSNAGLPINIGIDSIAIDPVTSSTLYVGTGGRGIYKSVDSGATWLAANVGLSSQAYISSIAIDPLTPSTLYVGVSSDWFGSGGGVFKSVDSGATWVSLNVKGVESIVIDPITPSILYGMSISSSGSNRGNGSIFKSIDSGATWVSLNTNGIGSIVIDPITTSTLYGSGVKGIFKSIDSGYSWTAVITRVVNQGVAFIAIDPVTPSTLYVGINGVVIKSIDGGLNWFAVKAGGSTSIAIDPSNPFLLYVGGGGGVQKGLSGLSAPSVGRSIAWSDVPSSILNQAKSTVYSIAINPKSPSVLYSASAGDVWKSLDSGLTWLATNASKTYITIPRFIAIDPKAPSTLYAATVGGGILKSIDSGGVWTSMNAGLKNLDFITIAIDPATPSTLYAGTFVGGVFKSIDSGKTWLSMNLGLMYQAIRSIAIDPVTPSTLYVGTNGGVFKSTDSGATWVSMSAGLIYKDIRSIAIDPMKHSIVYAGTAGGIVYKSIDSGITWIYSGLVGNGDINTIVIDPTKPSTLYAGTNGGLFKSVDSGLTWSSENAGLINADVFSIAIDPNNPSTFYAGTLNGGVYKGSIVDTVKPVITVNGINPVTVEAGQSYVDALATVTDNVDPTNAVLAGVNTVNSAAVGSYTVTYNASDVAGNPALAVIRAVNVVDTTKPVLTLPANAIANASGVRTVVAIGTATATDLFGVTISNNAPAAFTVGTTPVTWTATDANGRVSTGVQQVTVKAAVSAAKTLLMLSLGDVNGNGSGDFAVLGKRKSTGRYVIRVKDVNTVPALIREIGLNSAYKPVQMVRLPDMNGNGSREIAVLEVDPATGLNRQIQVKDGRTGAKIVNIPLKASVKPHMLVVLPDVNGNGSADLALSEVHAVTGNNVQIQVKDGRTGALIQNIRVSRSVKPHMLVSLGLINGAPALALSEVDAVTGKNVQIQVKNARTGAKVVNIRVKASAKPHMLVALPDVNGNGSPDLALSEVDAVTGKNVQIQVKDGKTGALIQNIRVDTAVKPHVLVSIGNINAVPALALSEVNAVTGKNVQIQVKNARTGAKVRNVLLNRNYKPSDLIVLADINGNGAPELALSEVNATTGKIVQVQVKDSLSGAKIRNIPMNPNYTPLGMATGPDSNGNGVAEIGLLEVNAAGNVQVQIKDPLTGAKVSNLAYPKF